MESNKGHKSSLYTKTGDRGTTSLTGGQRVKKSSLRLHCYGSVDELNSFLGLLVARPLTTFELEVLQSVQNSLFVIGSYLATDATDAEFKASCLLSSKQVEYLEKAIDRLDGEAPPMKGFVLPSGGETAARAHVARTVCRRVERLLFAFDEEEKVDTQILKYLNRLSDFLFILARVASLREGYQEQLWVKEDN